MNFFQRPDDYLDWTKLIQHCDVLEELTDIEKEQAKRAFQFLRQEFGEDFLSSEPGHPFVGNIVNTALWTRKWIIWFSEALKELKPQGNYSSLLARIRDKEKYAEAISVLEIAYKCSRAGFGITIDPVTGQSKVPDLKLTNQTTKEDLFVEISVLGESGRSKDAYETLNSIFTPLWTSVPFVRFSGLIHKTLAEKHLIDIASRVQKAVEKATKENVFQELIIKDVIELGIAPENDEELLEKWATARNLKVGEFSGPSYGVDETARIDQRFKHEQRQLPPDCPNVLIVWNNNVFFQSNDIRSTINQLEEIVYKYPHLLAGVIAGRHMGIAEMDVIMKDQHAFIQQTKADMIVEKYIILLNKYCDFKVSPSTITQLYESFRVN